ncbi:MAG: sigma-70 family RNA polymerase sigma factor [Pirellula sp.]|nr:sigma-70 family RNA polymerase sigma factor [Pirellula sp.]
MRRSDKELHWRLQRDTKMNDPNGRRPDPTTAEDLQTWFLNYKPLLKAIVSRKIDKELGGKADASDVLQDALSAAQANIEQMATKTPREFRGYLRRVLMTKIQDLKRRFLKSQKRDVHRELNAEDISSDEFRQIADNDGSPLDLLIDEEHFRRVMQAIGDLPPEIQKVLAWRFEQDMTYEEIGKKLGRTKDDVRMLMQRCIARLKQRFEEG